MVRGMVLHISESLEFTENFMVRGIRANAGGSHELPARNVVGLLELACYPSMAQGCKQCDVNRSQTCI